MNDSPFPKDTQKRSGLGRGLNALFTDEALPVSNSVIEVDIRLLDNNPSQPRQHFDEDKLRELADSIKRHGIIQPITVQRNGGRYTIVAGERRFRAAKLAGLEKVPVIISSLHDEEVFEVALIENIQREDLNPLEEAAAIRYLMVQHDLTQEETSQRLGKSRPSITNSLRLLNLSDHIQNYVRTKTIQPGHAKVLLGIADEKLRDTIADKLVDEGWSVRELENRLQNMDAPKTQTHAPKAEKQTSNMRMDPALAHAQDRLRAALETQVSIVGGLKRGKIVIEYYNAETLDALYNFLTRHLPPEE